MEISATRYSAILAFKGLPVGTTAEELADFLWREIGLGLQVSDIELFPVGAGLNATVRVPRGSLADFLDRAVAAVPFRGRHQICVRPKFRQRPDPNEGREEEEQQLCLKNLSSQR